MLPFGLRDLQVTALAELQPGATFIHTDRNGGQHLAVALAQDRPGHPAWLNLDGPGAFQLHTMDRPHRVSVLSLGIPADRLRLRVDRSSAVSDNSRHEPGHLVFPNGGHACIAVVWPGMEDMDRRYVVELGGWACTVDSSPSFMFDRWSLSFADETGEWVDLVTRAPVS